MASPQEIHVTLGDHPIPDEISTATLGGALERVLEVQQDLVIRRATLLVEELIARVSRFVSGSLIAALGGAIALAGWFIAMAGLVDALDEHAPRFAIEMALGVFHVAAGLAIVYARRSLWRAST